MYQICPKCGSIAEYNAYYGRYTCVNCSWQSEKCREKGSSHKEKIEAAKAKAIAAIASRCLSYSEQGFLPELIKTIFAKKIEYLKTAQTLKDIDLIQKPSTTHFDGSRFYEPPFYVQEEELILWSLTSLKAPLLPEAQKRYEELFRKQFPEIDL